MDEQFDETILCLEEKIGGGCRVNVYPRGTGRISCSLTSLQRGSSPKKSSPAGINYSSFLRFSNGITLPGNPRSRAATFLSSSFLFPLIFFLDTLDDSFSSIVIEN